MSEEEVIVIELRVDNPAAIDTVGIAIQLDEGTNDFQRNYFFYERTT